MISDKLSLNRYMYVLSLCNVEEVLQLANERVNLGIEWNARDCDDYVKKWKKRKQISAESLIIKERKGRALILITFAKKQKIQKTRIEWMRVDWNAHHSSQYVWCECDVNKRRLDKSADSVDAFLR